MTAGAPLLEANADVAPRRGAEPTVEVTRRADDAVSTAARWLLVAALADLVVTRLLVRLAIFIPKDETWAAAGLLLGRVGAATDALVLIVALALLGAMLLRAGRHGDRLEQAMLVGATLIAIGGLALLVLPGLPVTALAVDATVVLVAVAAGLRAVRSGRAGRPAAVGLAALAAAVAMVAVARIAGLVALPAGDGLGAMPFLIAGEVLFVAGMGLVGLAGLTEARRSHRPHRVAALAGVGVGVGVLAFAVRAPQVLGAVAIWGTGLAGAVPVILVAPAAAVAIAGIPGLHDRHRCVALGVAIVLAAGYGLAGNGLLLAGVLGLVVASSAPSDA